VRGRNTRPGPRAPSAAGPMTSKERLRVAMSGGVPDRVPVLPQICPPHAIRVAGLPFRQTIVDRLRDPRKYDLLEAQCAADYGVDGVRVWLGAPPATVEWDGAEAYQLDPDTGERLAAVDFMGGGGALRLKSKQRPLTEEDIEAVRVIPADDLVESQALAPARKVVDTFGDRLFIVGVPRTFMVNSLFYVEGMERTLMDIVDRPEFIQRFAERQAEAAIQEAIAFARVGVDAIYVGETFGQFMSPEQFERLCVPYIRKFVEAVRPHGPLIYLHMCGRITHLLDLIVQTGVDCLEPLDEVGGTPVAEVKRRVGQRVALMGGVNTVLLSRGTLAEVEADCARCLREAKQGGGYILAACDMLPTETAPEKVRAMVRAADTLGRYAP